MDKKDFKDFPRTTSCPNCPINCYSTEGALKHAAICNKRRDSGFCCLCKEDKEEAERYPSYYNPKEGRYWHLCYRCYNWCKNKSICL